jgi:hypothetical protein
MSTRRRPYRDDVVIRPFRRVPIGCILHPVANEETAPLLRCGQFAVVDTNDDEPLVGRLYVVEQNSPLSFPTGKRRRIVQVCFFGDGTLLDGSPALFIGAYARNQHIPGYGPTRMLDGAFDKNGLRSMVIGRVVGVMTAVSQWN